MKYLFSIWLAAAYLMTVSWGSYDVNWRLDSKQHSKVKQSIEEQLRRLRAIQAQKGIKLMKFNT